MRTDPQFSWLRRRMRPRTIRSGQHFHDRYARDRAPASETARQTVKVLVEGVARAEVRKYTRTDEYYEADAEAVSERTKDQVEAEALSRSVVSEFENYVKLNKKFSPEVVAAVTQIDDTASSPTPSLRICGQDRRQAGGAGNVVGSKRLEKCL